MATMELHTLSDAALAEIKEAAHQAGYRACQRDALKAAENAPASGGFLAIHQAIHDLKPARPVSPGGVEAVPDSTVAMIERLRREPTFVDDLVAAARKLERDRALADVEREYQKTEPVGSKSWSRFVAALARLRGGSRG